MKMKRRTQRMEKGDKDGKEKVRRKGRKERRKRKERIKTMSRKVIKRKSTNRYKVEGTVTRRKKEMR